MKEIKSIQLKAAFLLIIFSLNVVVGFACSCGIDMGFNAHHHDDEETTVTKNCCHHGRNNARNNHSKKDNCCSNDVTTIIQSVKILPQTHSLVNPVFSTAFIETYYNHYLGYPSQVTFAKKYFELGYDPPGSEIRVFIQSFQI